MPQVMKAVLFNTPMTKAILEDRKRTTRRLVKVGNHTVIRGGTFPGSADGAKYGVELDDHGVIVAPYQTGDILYVRETWQVQSASRFDASVKIQFKAGGPITRIQFPGYRSDTASRAEYDEFISKWMKRGGWFPSIHLPKAAARIFLRVDGVRAEPLQTSFFEPICPIFAVRDEGIDIGETCRECIENYGEPCCVDTVDEDGSDLYGGECGELDASRSEFSDLWDSTIRPADLDRNGWAANPWVFVYDFHRISKEEALK